MTNIRNIHETTALFRIIQWETNSFTIRNDSKRFAFHDAFLITGPSPGNCVSKAAQEFLLAVPLLAQVSKGQGQSLLSAKRGLNPFLRGSPFFVFDWRFEDLPNIILELTKRKTDNSFLNSHKSFLLLDSVRTKEYHMHLVHDDHLYKKYFYFCA